MAEPVFRTLEIVDTITVAAAGTEITYNGLDNVPTRGGAIASINHTSYIDWLPAAMAAHHRRRRMRFMIKEEMQQVRIIRYLIDHTGTIPVNRSAGAQAYTVAVERLTAGEIVGVYPEATISRSFELKEFKSGAARMAREANVPIVPIIVWGAQRIWTKDHPRNLGRSKIPITVHVGAPVFADHSVEGTNVALKESMTTLLYGAQQDYPHPPGAFWVPRRLGGSAPTLAEAKLLDEAELVERARRRAERTT